MQTVETLNEGLKRAYTLTIPASAIEARVDAEIKRVAPQVRMPGFRPGKVPANLVRKMHGDAMLQEALNTSIQEGIQSLIADKQLRPAVQPSVELVEGYAPGKDAELKVELEVLPQVPAPAIDNLKLERLTVPVDDAAVDAQLQKFADQQKRWDDAGDKAAETGDLVTVDFVGKTMDGVAFDGGTGTDMAVEIGAGRLIPGFEDQVIGAKAGEERQIKVTFPADYGAKELAGKDATFDLTIKSVKTAGASVIDEELATSLGLESLDQLKGLLKGQIEQEHNGLTRTYMKRKLLDQLAEGHDFDVPPSMVEAEFNQIWQQLQHEATHEADPDAALKEMEAEREDYRKIAERRVRLGLLLSEIGQANGVEVSQQEMQRLMMQAAQQYGPEDRQRFIQYVQQDPMAAAQLRAPLYEDKVVDFLFDKAEVTDRETTREELEAAIESEDGFATGTHHHDHDNHKPKQTKAKKAAASETGDAAEGDAPAKPAKKAAAKKPSAKSEDAAVEPTEADAAPAKKPRAKKAAAPAEDDAAPAAETAPAKKPRAKKAAGGDAE
ncbi:trigger factor [Sphingomonas ginsenosidimutans]|jgi:trigger factor|uniref:Trigger factor n=1 Tax=Sphingomonas ginsenosidimutans TaxID=862134 RepID=A0A2A4I3A9_9SPHN|nr:trigger factor [Sphingomonas ginsenosidimutans]MEE2915995.1 trigger factor [Pseudomonadota bacterium]PCG10771.1 trigger factor [Sphingomonas ginsenosidimutans]